MCSARLLTERASAKKRKCIKSWRRGGLNDIRRRPCFAACTRSRDENPWTATANERRGRAVIGRYYKRGHRCPGTVSRTSDRAARGCAGEKAERASERASKRANGRTGDAGESRRECDPDSRLLAMPRSSRACHRRRETGLKEAGGSGRAMIGAGASSDIVPRHANRLRHAVNIALNKTRD